MKQVRFLQKFLFLLGIPVILVCVWGFLAIGKNTDYPFSILFIPQQPGDTISQDFHELYKGQKLLGSFVAKENNLGVLQVRFYNFQRISSDRLIFRIKEKNAKDWYYENSYKVDQFQPDAYFPFGFPTIGNAKNRAYIFELESVEGKKYNAIALSKNTPYTQTEYELDKSLFRHNGFYAGRYTIQKFVEFLSNPLRVLYSTIYLLPLLLYLIWYERKEKNNIGSFFLFLFTGVFILLYFSQEDYNQYEEIFIAVLSLILVLKKNIFSKKIYISSLVLFGVSSICITLGFETIGNKLGILFYFCLLVGLIKMAWETYGHFFTIKNGKKILSKIDHIFEKGNSFSLFLLCIGILFINLYRPILGVLQNKVWLGWGYPNYLVGNLDNFMSPLSAWRDFLGEPTFPRIFDVLYYYPLKLLLLLHISGNEAWIVYVYAVFIFGFVAFSLLVKKLFPDISPLGRYISSLLYMSYLPLNYELGSFGLKIVGAAIPFFLYLTIICFEKMKSKKKSSMILLWVFLIGLSTNILIIDPRGFIISILLFLGISIFWISQNNTKREVIGVILFVLFYAIGVCIVSIPTEYTQKAMYASGLSLAAPIKDAVYVSKSFLNTLFLQPSPILSLPQNTFFLLGSSVLFLYSGIFFLLKDTRRRRVGFFIVGLFLMYILFVQDSLLQILVTHIPFGQLFRSWRLSQYLGAFLLSFFFLGIWISKVKILRLLALICVCLYIAISLQTVNATYLLVAKKDITPYLHANEFLVKDPEGFKVLWAPEMGLFSGEYPFWTNGVDAAQSFPEFMSQKPTYTHYYNSMTHAYTWIASGVETSELQKNTHIDMLLTTLGVKYLILHDDVKAYSLSYKNMVQNLQKDSAMQQVFSEKYITIYKNTSYKSRLWLTDQKNAVICYQGLSCLSEVYKNLSPYQATAYLSDLILPNALSNLPVFTSNSSSTKDIQLTLLLNTLISRHYPHILFANNFFSTLDAVGCPSDTHQGGYHIYWQKSMQYDYSYNFFPGNCYFLLIPNRPITQINKTLQQGDYEIVIRYMKQQLPAAFSITTQNISETIVAGNATGNMYTYVTLPLKIEKTRDVDVTLQNKDGNNFISLIAFVPKQTIDSFMIKNTIVDTLPPQEERSPVIEKIKQIGPATWEFSANISSPSVLNFAESYNPLWKVSIKNVNGEMKTFSPAQGYGIINSYTLPKMGEVKGILQYEPQKKFFYYVVGAIIGITLLGLFLTLCVRKLL